MAAVLTRSGRTAIAAAIKARPALHMAWGSGDPAWGNTPPSPSNDATALVAEIARRKATLVEFCTPAGNGSIQVPEGRFNITATPSPYLYFKFAFEFEDAPSATIREVAVFMDTVTEAGVPAGQFYLLPADIDDPGIMLVVERRAPIVRSSTTRQVFEFVLEL